MAKSKIAKKLSTRALVKAVAEREAKPVVAEKPAIKAVSVDKMVEENIKAVHTSDYQTYLRKLMREAMGKF